MSTPDDRTMPAPFVESELVTIAEAAARLGCHERTIRRHIKAGTLAAIPDRGRLLVQLAGLSDLSEVRQIPARMRAGAARPNADNARSAQQDADSRLIAHLEAEIADLRERLRTADARIDRMLPASVGRPRRAWQDWLFWAVVALILALTVYMVAYTVAPDPATIHRLAAAA